MNDHNGNQRHAVSVTEMARTLGFSRTRLYQLVRAGVLPSPRRDEQTSRPFFDAEQQAQCITVKQMNRGINGQVVLFYQARVPRNGTVKRQRSKKLDVCEAAAPGSELAWLRKGLQQLGSPGVSDERLRIALTTVGEIDDPSRLLAAVYRVLTAQNSHDNLA